MTSIVHLLFHRHEIDGGSDDVKLIGAYESDEAALSAADRLRSQPGFNEFPDNFVVHRHVIGRDGWSLGFGIGLSPDIRDTIEPCDVGELSMAVVYLVWHEYEMPEEVAHERLIGVYVTEDEAQKAIARSRRLPGFRDHPDGFTCGRYMVGEDHWREGFVTMRW